MLGSRDIEQWDNTQMPRLERIMIFWGVCDLLFTGWYIVSCIFGFTTPFFAVDFIGALKDIHSLPPILIALVTCALMLYLSIVASGVLLCFGKRVGAIVYYAQVPFRIFLFAPSLWCIIWPLKFFSRSFTLAWILLAISEGSRLASMIAWQRRATLTA